VGRRPAGRQLDLTTNKVQNRAFVYSGPTVVDLDGDGKLEIVQSTSQGFAGGPAPRWMGGRERECVRRAGWAGGPGFQVRRHQPTLSRK